MPHPRRAIAGAVLALALAYSAAHFAISGVRNALAVPNNGQIEEEYEVLRKHLATGRPIRIEQPRQYGPTFILSMHALLKACGGDGPCVLRSLYAMQLAGAAIAFACCWLSLRLWIARVWPDALDRVDLAAVAVLLVVLWSNFAPLLAIIATKNVETWEISLLCAALYAYLRERRVVAGALVAAAALIKLLPFAIFFYFLLVDRRALAYASAAALVILAVAHALYGPEMGLMYLVNIGIGAAAPASFGNVPAALAWHENVSLKGIVAKMFGHLELPRSSAPRLGVYEQVGYVTVAEPRLHFWGNLVSSAVQAAAIVWMTWVIAARKHTAAMVRESRVLWEWSFVTVMMLIVAPQTAIDYEMLALVAFSFVLVAGLVLPPARRDAAMWACYAAAVLLVGNIVPRSLVVRASLVTVLMNWSGYTHLKPLEGYSYYGYPLLGMLLMTAALMRLSRSLAAPQPV